MRENLGQENFGKRRTDYAPLDLEADWSYLRANLDHPAHRMASKLGSGLAAWLSRRLHASASPAPQLSILARIALGPRQSLALVEAEGVHVLVGTSADGPPSFFSLADGSGHSADQPLNPEISFPSGAGSNPPQPGGSDSPTGRRLGLNSGSQSSSQAGLRPLSRSRLAGRVSWV
jgi:flagellar biosynthesis protein FliO